MTSIQRLFNKLFTNGIFNNLEKDILTNPTQYTFLTDDPVENNGRYNDDKIEFSLSPQRMIMMKKLNYSYKIIRSANLNMIHEYVRYVIFINEDEGISTDYQKYYNINGDFITEYKGGDSSNIVVQHMRQCDRLGYGYHTADWSRNQMLKYKLASSVELHETFIPNI